MMLTDMAPDVVTKVLTEHGLSLKDQLNMYKAAKTLQDFIERPGVRMWKVHFHKAWDEVRKRAFVDWFLKHVVYVEALEMELGDLKDWALFMDMLTAYHESARFPRTALHIEDDQVLSRLRELAHARRYLPPLHEVRCSCEEPYAPRLFLLQAHMFGALEKLVFEDVLVEYDQDTDEAYQFPLTALPATLKTLYFDDDVGKVSLAVAPRVPSGIEELMLHVTPELVRRLPSLPRLRELSVTGWLDAESLCLIFQKAPNLAVISHPVYRPALAVRDLDRVGSFPDSLLEAAFLFREPLTPENPVFHSNLQDLSLYFDMDPDDDPVVIPEAIADTRLKSLYIEARVEVELPDVSAVPLELMRFRCPRATVAKCGDATVSYYHYCTDLSYNPSDDEDSESM